jgi:alpha-D-ribose 1-methylphosphonate 5-triphosphate synthase subunit PhnG
MRLPHRFIPPFCALILVSFLAVTPSASFAQSQPQLPPKWNDAVRRLAERIVTIATPLREVTLDVRNMSALRASEVVDVRRALESELARLQVRIVQTGSAAAEPAAKVQLTFSEGVEGYVWIAEIRRDDAQQTAIVTAPRQPDSFTDRARNPLVLSRRLIWEQKDEILDFALVLPSLAGVASTLVILEPERLAFYGDKEGNWQLERTIPIVHSAPWPRDLRGRIDLTAAKAVLPGVICAGDFQYPETVQCAGDPTAKVSVLTSGDMRARMQALGVEDFVVLQPGCTAGFTVLGTGPGDWTQVDCVQAYEMAGEIEASGLPVQFPGPVLALWPTEDGRSARVISMELQTGMYEASIVSVSCGN